MRANSQKCCRIAFARSSRLEARSLAIPNLQMLGEFMNWPAANQWTPRTMNLVARLKKLLQYRPPRFTAVRMESARGKPVSRRPPPGRKASRSKEAIAEWPRIQPRCLRLRTGFANQRARGSHSIGVAGGALSSLTRLGKNEGMANVRACFQSISAACNDLRERTVVPMILLLPASSPRPDAGLGEMVPSYCTIDEVKMGCRIAAHKAILNVQRFRNGFLFSWLAGGSFPCP